jgi:hypothetical protein
MGTSKGYDAPTTPQWGELKGNVTKSAKEGLLNSDRARQLVGQFIQANRGNQGLGINKDNGTRNAQAVARNLGRFISLVGSVGFSQAMLKAGLEHLRGKSKSDIILALIDYFGEDASTIDQVDARNALSQLMSEMFEGVEDLDEIEQIFEEYTNTENLTLMLEKFFGYYVYQLFCRSFYERLASRVGNDQAGQFLNDILDFIKSEIKVFSLDKDISQVDWNGKAGESICTEIMEKTLEVFGG